MSPTRNIWRQASSTVDDNTAAEPSDGTRAFGLPEPPERAPQTFQNPLIKEYTLHYNRTFQNSLIKEYTLNSIRIPNMI